MISADTYEDDVAKLTPTELLNEETYLIIEEMDDLQRSCYKEQLKVRAKELGIKLRVVDELFKAAKKTIEKDNTDYSKAIEQTKAIPLELTAKGFPAQTIDNNLRVMRADTYFESIRFNALTNAPEKHNGELKERWTDFDDSLAKHYLETQYNLSNENKYMTALNVLFVERSYHPVRDLIESLEWDGVSRIKTFLSKWMKCEDTEYTREVSRIIFAGGINRIYRPACKFEDVPILIGTKQGEGKSTFVRWLAMDDKFFREVNDMEGQRGSEAVEGAWICEISELLALTKSKEVELVKSYISRQTETYRRAYDKRVTDYDRQCIFIGTTNREEFLTDRTGNRRFYPIKCNQTGFELFNHEDECKEDIRQCWAEAYTLFKQGSPEVNPFFSRSLIAEAREMQKQATEDDYRLGIIEEYAKGKNFLCVIDVWENALGNQYKAPTRKESMEIAQMLNGLEEFRPMKKRRWFKVVLYKDEYTEESKTYGTQKAWERIKFH